MGWLAAGDIYETMPPCVLDEQAAIVKHADAALPGLQATDCLIPPVRKRDSEPAVEPDAEARLPLPHSKHRRHPLSMGAGLAITGRVNWGVHKPAESNVRPKCGGTRSQSGPKSVREFLGWGYLNDGP